MGAVKLELRGPENVNGIVADPKPDWSFDTLLLELNALEHTLNASSLVPVPFTKTRSREFSPVRKIDRSANAFVMHISDDELDDMDSDGQEVYNQSLVAGRRFSCDELSLSDSDESEYGSAIGKPLYLMDKAGTVEGALVELTHEHWLGVEDEIRNQISALETDLLNGSDKFTSSLVRVEKYTESRREMDKKLDTQYQRKIAEALDSHLTAVQREHEHRSQIEERKIRNDAAVEEAKRKEKALREEKMRQEKIKAEAEARLVAEKKRAEEAKIVALEVERSTVKEPAEKVVKEISKRAASAEVAEVETQVHKTDSSLSVKNAQFGGSGSDTLKKLQSAGNILHSAENALKLEEIRLQNYNELVKRNQALRSGSNMDFQSYERKIARQIKQTSGTKEAVRAKANELIKIFSDPHCPQSITIAIFAEKVISLCENPGSAAFALGHVIVLVASKFPLAMDLIIAEFHRACVYTVPKHITYSQSVFETKEAYKKIIGFREEDGKLESTKQYLQRLESYMKLYGALVQTQIEGVQNSYGLNEGWAWVARLLNALPANIYTAVALEAFLKLQKLDIHWNLW
ncbi:mRNA export factor GLE1 isoform X2 [Malania oleifera]|uniref:mRNA export factor GLE1 isoform X2 n=1 Tax=Malania oleifera TaxID=397392 RepID=UPI0025AE3E6C|nr:mRNA export factor GLE1 isoform X2 [Malania oleifera]